MSPTSKREYVCAISQRYRAASRLVKQQILTECCATGRPASSQPWTRSPTPPFSLQGLDSDNGSEFINHHLFRYCQEYGIQFTRGRKLLGWDRYDTPRGPGGHQRPLPPRTPAHDEPVSTIREARPESPRRLPPPAGL